VRVGEEDGEARHGGEITAAFPGGSAWHRGRGLGQELQNSPDGGRVDLQNSLMMLV
jgi:hypothetical protein